MTNARVTSALTNPSCIALHHVAVQLRNWKRPQARKGRKKEKRDQETCLRREHELLSRLAREIIGPAQMNPTCKILIPRIPHPRQKITVDTLVRGSRAPGGNSCRGGAKRVISDRDLIDEHSRSAVTRGPRSRVSIPAKPRRLLGPCVWYEN